MLTALIFYLLGSQLIYTCADIFRIAKESDKINDDDDDIIGPLPPTGDVSISVIIIYCCGEQISRAIVFWMENELLVNTKFTNICVLQIPCSIQMCLSLMHT